MSHFSVAVFSNDPVSYAFDELLAPYSETDEKYFTFTEVSEAELKQRFERFHKNNPDYTFEAFLNAEGYVKENGVYGYHANPNAMWDYYTLDGRDFLFDPKPGQEMDDDAYYFRKSQIDFMKADPSEEKRAIQFWREYVEKRNKNMRSLMAPEYYISRYKTKEQYAKECARTVPYAFITPDGVWHAPGRVGWFAISDETAESSDAYWEEWASFINDPTTDPYVSFVDCHI